MGRRRRGTFRLWAQAAGSLEAVQDLALHAVLDLAAPQHELQDLVDGVLWVFLRTQGRMQKSASRGDPRHPPTCPLGPTEPATEPTCPPAHRELSITPPRITGLTLPERLARTTGCSIFTNNSFRRHNNAMQLVYNHPLLTGEETEAQSSVTQ